MYQHESPGERALCFWSWNAKLDLPELVRQLEDFANGKFGGVIIHSRAGLEVPYMGEEWFEAYSAALKEAKRLGLHVWIYDEDGWPSGFAGGAVPALGDQHCLKKLKSRYGGDYTENILAVYRLMPDGSKREHIQPNAGMKIEENDLVFYIEIDRHYVDLLNRETVANFIRLTHEKYKEKFLEYFGNVIKGVFTDEPQVNVDGFAWSDSLPDGFKLMYGEELWLKLYLLVEPADGYKLFRYKFWKLVNSLMFESYTKQIAEWCGRNNLILTGHFGAEDGLCEQVASNGGVMTHYTAMQMPGIDYLGNRLTSPVLIKQLSSIAHQMNKPYTLSETFGCSGWSISFMQLAWIWGYQSALGVTTPCFHLSPLSIKGRRKRDYPVFFSSHEPWWDQFPQFIKWMTSLNRMMAEGERLVDTLVVSPIYSVMAEFDKSSKSDGAMSHYSGQFRLLNENLLDIQLDYEIGHEAVMEEYGKVENGRLKVGKASYSTVFVSECQSITENTYRLLKELVEQGGSVIFVGRKPSMIDMKPSSKINEISAPVIQNRREIIERWVKFCKIPRYAQVVSSEDCSVLQGVIVHTRKLAQGYRVHIWTDSSFSGKKAVLQVDEPASVVMIDPHTNKETVLQVDYVEGKSLAGVNLAPKANYVFDLLPKKLEQKGLMNLIAKKRVGDIKVTTPHDNCLTLDQGCISINDGPYSEPMAIIHMVDKIYQYQSQAQNSFKVSIQYSFVCDESFKPKSLLMSLEDENLAEIEVNFKPLNDVRHGWWIDPSMGQYDIAEFVRSGKNTITLTYNVPAVKKTVDIGKVFETERNRFFYPLEPDVVVLRGDFDVAADGKIENEVLHHRVESGCFRITSPTAKKMGDLSKQGMWFYRGDAEYSFSIKKSPGNRRLELVFGRVNGACIEWQIGSHTGVLIQNPLKLDITDYLTEDETPVLIRLKGTNRNLFGPHHHIKGEPAIVGPSTFHGRYGFEDFVSPDITGEDTWTDDYSFAPFGIEDIYICEYRTYEG